ncbi:hypothetical protein JOQ06_021596 [Pogonophryne albipinna]|uniref:Uncharacterized protein n=1 Tax=Pogonophryne albipinna TaxID=1090488 RepID=A0AAD6AF24_9TELE|nr:hypothetical protein JOQ06_021587 [Pogonophryne albipinna]KAJ4923530.1 hypothetical protein JOQ06_021596 [Pogonophryne albipinna]
MDGPDSFLYIENGHVLQCLNIVRQSQPQLVSEGDGESYTPLSDLVLLLRRKKELSCLGLKKVLRNTDISGLITEEAETLVTHICDQLFQESLLRRLNKRELLQDITTLQLTRLDVADKNNRLHPQDIDIGLGAESILKSTKGVELTVLEFRRDCMQG